MYYAEVIYQSEQAVLREKAGIEKMLNVKFGEYHTPDILSDTEKLLIEMP